MTRALGLPQQNLLEANSVKVPVRSPGAIDHNAAWAHHERRFHPLGVLEGVVAVSVSNKAQAGHDGQSYQERNGLRIVLRGWSTAPTFKNSPAEWDVRAGYSIT